MYFFYLYKIPYVLDGTLRVLKLREQRWLIFLVNMGLRVFTMSKPRAVKTLWLIFLVKME